MGTRLQCLCSGSSTAMVRVRAVGLRPRWQKNQERWGVLRCQKELTDWLTDWASLRLTDGILALSKPKTLQFEPRFSDGCIFPSPLFFPPRLHELSRCAETVRGFSTIWSLRAFTLFLPSSSSLAAKTAAEAAEAEAPYGANNVGSLKLWADSV